MKAIRNLKQHDVRVVVLVAKHNALAEASHTILLIVCLQSVQALFDGGILLGLLGFCADFVAAEWVKTDCGWLVRVECSGNDRPR